MKTCPVCKAENLDAAEVCWNCSAPVARLEHRSKIMRALSVLWGAVWGGVAGAIVGFFVSVGWVMESDIPGPIGDPQAFFALGGAVIGALLGAAIAWDTRGKPEEAARLRWAFWSTALGLCTGVCAGAWARMLLGADEGSFWWSAIGLVPGGAIGWFAAPWIRKLDHMIRREFRGDELESSRSERTEQQAAVPRQGSKPAGGEPSEKPAADTVPVADAVGRDRFPEGLPAPDYRRWVIGLTALGALLGFAPGGWFGAYGDIIWWVLAVVGGLIGGWIGYRSGRVLGVTPVPDRAWILTQADAGAGIGVILGGLVGMPVGFLISPQYEMVPLLFAIAGGIEGALLGGLAGAFVGGYRGRKIAAERRSMVEPPPLPLPQVSQRKQHIGLSVVLSLIALGLLVAGGMIGWAKAILWAAILVGFWILAAAVRRWIRRWMRERR